MSLPSGMADFVPCHRLLRKAYSSDSVLPFDSSPLIESDSAKPKVKTFEAVSFKLLAPTSLEVERCEACETPETSLKGWSNQNHLSQAA